MLSNNITVLKKVVFSDSDGNSTDITQLCSDIIIEESLFNMYMTGFVSITDVSSFIEKINNDKDKFLTINIFNGMTKYEQSLTFQIHAITDFNKINDSKFEYKINFCSSEFFIQSKMRISKGLSGTKVAILSNILSPITKKKLLMKNDNKNGVLLSPRLKPFDLIDLLLLYDKNSSDYVFWENFRGFNCNSVTSMLQRKTSFNFYETQINALDDSQIIKEDVENNHHIIKSYKIPSFFNKIIDVDEGVSGATLISYDYLKGTPTEYYINKDYKKQKIYIHEDNNLNYTNYLQRHSILTQLLNNEWFILVNGNYTNSTGDCVHVRLLQSNNNPGYSQTISGNYIITSIKHMINKNSYIQEIGISH